MSESLLGRFVWYQLMTPDVAAGRDFYTRLIGWGTEVWEGGGAPYAMFTNQGVALAGMMELPPEAVAGGARAHWLGYVATPDVDATTARARELGAKVMVPPSDIPTVGRFAVWCDPQGALLAVYTPATEPPETGRAKVGEVEWHELATTEREAAFAFYSELFGWQTVEAVDMGEMGIYQIIGRPGASFPLGAVFKKPAEMPGPPAWLYYVRVADIHAALEQVKALGGQVLLGPHQVPDGDLIAHCLDPQGGPFALHWSDRHDD